MSIIPSWFFFILGCIFGSFLNVCILRIPRNESVVYAPSHCPNCSLPIAPYDNIPVISYILLLGKCRQCKSIISFQYPLVEIISGLVTWQLYLKYGLTLNFLMFAVLSMVLLVLAVIDIHHQVLFNKITIPGVFVGFALSFYRPDFTPLQALFGFLLGGGIFYAIAIISPRGMGGGDIKLMAMCGTFIGWSASLITIFLASVSGAVIGSVFILLSKRGRKTRIPFGPFIVFGSIVSILWEREIVSWYLQTFFMF